MKLHTTIRLAEADMSLIRTVDRVLYHAVTRGLRASMSNATSSIWR